MLIRQQTPLHAYLARLLAHLTFWLHAGFLLFLFLGGVLHHYLYGSHPGAAQWVLGLHLTALVYAVVISVFVLPCPLTALQKWFERLGGREPFEGDCVAHYLWSRLPVEGSETWLLVSLLCIALLINGPLYFLSL